MLTARTSYENANSTMVILPILILKLILKLFSVIRLTHLNPNSVLLQLVDTTSDF